jgi:hypothetical protein
LHTKINFKGFLQVKRQIVSSILYAKRVTVIRIWRGGELAKLVGQWVRRNIIFVVWPVAIDQYRYYAII